jgi:hypothetical protein
LKIENTQVKNYCQLSETSLGGGRGGGQQYTLPKKRFSHIQNYRGKTLLSPRVPSTLTSLLQPNILMEGNDIEDFWSLLISANPNMSFMAIHPSPYIRQYGETQWDEHIATQISNSPQRSVEMLQKENPIIFIPWLT